MGERKRAIRSANVGSNSSTTSKPSAQALIELALILPILLVLIIGALEFGRVLYTKIIITNAAREGAYYLSTHSTTSDSCDAMCEAGTYNAAANEASSSGVSLNPGDVVVASPFPPDPDPATDLYIGKVTVQTQVQDLLILGFLGDAFHLTSSTGDFTVTSSVEMMIQ